MADKVVDALKWIKSILDKNTMDYQIVGGLAAVIHGGSRPVADIDLYVPKESGRKLANLLKQYISKPLVHYKESGWDLEYFQIIYHGQKIELGLSPGTRILDRATGEWIELHIDFSASILGEYKGVEVPVIPKTELIAYKSIWLVKLI